VKQLIAGNWKMNGTRQSCRDLAKDVAAASGDLGGVDLAIFPPCPFLGDAGDVLRGTRVSLGAQDLHTEAKGAFTGAISGPMIASIGCRYVLVGHSERRHVFGDSDEIVAQKLARALEADLDPVLCIGETLEERDAGEGADVVRRQMALALEGYPAEKTGALTIAYEPVWAIGTGRAATPEMATEMHETVRADLLGRFGEAGGGIRILYGGSVTPGNAADLLSRPPIQGVLVGGASLKSESFLAIARAGQGA
jgi:triosephosphate isomerase